jgi:hypothetical protein
VSVDTSRYAEILVCGECKLLVGNKCDVAESRVVFFGRRLRAKVVKTSVAHAKLSINR